MSNELKKMLGIAVVGKVVHDVDELKKQAKIQADEARKQTAISERMLENEVRDRARRESREEENAERLLLSQRESAKKLIEIEEERAIEDRRRIRQEKSQKFIEEERFGLTSFSGKVLFSYYDKYPLGIGINSAVQVIKILPEKQQLEFLLLAQDMRGSLLKQYIQEQCLKFNSLSAEMIEEELINFLAECISYEEFDYKILLDDNLKNKNELAKKNEKMRQARSKRRLESEMKEQVDAEKDRIKSQLCSKTYSVQEDKPKYREKQAI